MKMIKKNMDLLWDFENILLNPNISISFIEKYIIPRGIHFIDKF